MGRDNMDGGGPGPTDHNPYATDEYWKDRATTEGPHPVANDEEQTDTDAFSPDNIGVVQFIVLSRILDTLYAMHRLQDPEGHVELLEAHSQGLLLGPSPTFQGLFLTDEINREV